MPYIGVRWVKVPHCSNRYNVTWLSPMTHNCFQLIGLNDTCVLPWATPVSAITAPVAQDLIMQMNTLYYLVLLLTKLSSRSLVMTINLLCDFHQLKIRDSYNPSLLHLSYEQFYENIELCTIYVLDLLRLISIQKRETLGWKFLAEVYSLNMQWYCLLHSRW